MKIVTRMGEEVELDITYERYLEIKERVKKEHIQNVAPELPPCHRELFITGMGPHEYAALWGNVCTNWEQDSPNPCIYYKKHNKCLYDDIKLVTDEELEEAENNEDDI
jgi:hypothetical protein